MENATEQPENVGESCSASAGLLASQAVWAQSSMERAESYQNGINSFTKDHLRYIMNHAPDNYIRSDAQMTLYLVETGFLSRAPAPEEMGQLELELQQPAKNVVPLHPKENKVQKGAPDDAYMKAV